MTPAFSGERYTIPELLGFKPSLRIEGKCSDFV